MDVAALAAKGVVTTNTPLSIRRPVAVAALTHIFAQTTRLITKDQLVREDRWDDRADYMGVGLSTRTLAIIGAGGIERVVEIKLTKDEQAMFDNSVAAVKGLVEACKGIDESLA